MKKLLLAIALMATVSFADAQGTIQFPRLRIEYCLSPATEAPPAGALSFGIFAGPTADSLSSQPILPLGTNTATGFTSGPNAYPLPGFEPGSTVFLQIRGWETRFGLDWQTGRTGGLYGETPILQVLLGPASGPGTVIASPDGEIIMCVPEPSAVAVSALGLCSLLLLRRRKQS